MIISHLHRFIFVKTAKTAGSSIEIGLARLCGPDDVITPLPPHEEELRPGHHAQNYVLPVWRRPLSWWPKQLMGVDEKWSGARFYDHINARRIRAMIGRRTFDSYFKISVERNPWDREVSNYFFRIRRLAEPPSFEQFVLDPAKHHVLKNYQAYTIDGACVVDRVMRYERLREEIAELGDRLGVEGSIELPRAKSRLRPSGVPYRDFYCGRTRERVAELYAREIALFGYTF